MLCSECKREKARYIKQEQDRPYCERCSLPPETKGQREAKRDKTEGKVDRQWTAQEEGGKDQGGKSDRDPG